jgi:hypothetical protein
MRKLFLAMAALLLLLPFRAFAGETDELRLKLNSLEEQMKALQQQIQELEKAKAAAPAETEVASTEEAAPEEEKPSRTSWLDIGGDYRFRYDYLHGKTAPFIRFQDALGFMLGGPPPVPVPGETVRNDSLMTNRFGINLGAKATEDVEVRARLLMYKVWGHQTDLPITDGAGPFFADRVSVFDGSVGHVPSDSIIRADYAFATWSNVFNAPVWFSVGRRPSTGGVPGNLRQNREKMGTAGIPNILVDYAFDGLTIGYVPSIDALPGAYAKLCYGKGFDSGWEGFGNELKDVQMLGLNIVPYNTENLHIEVQWNRAIDIFDNLPDAGVHANLGNIDQFGGVVMGKVGNLNLFASGAVSHTDPSNETYNVMADTDGDGVPDTSIPVAGLLNSCGPTGCPTDSHTGWAAYVGARYDIDSTRTKIGAEFNHGSKEWITFVPAADDIWTAKLGTRGNVYEVYVIQELKKLPISPRGLAFFRLGWQYYTFDYTGTNSWIGAPEDIDKITAQFFPPVKEAHDVYFTFDVRF